MSRTRALDQTNVTSVPVRDARINCSHWGAFLNINTPINNKWWEPSSSSLLRLTLWTVHVCGRSSKMMVCPQNSSAYWNLIMRIHGPRYKVSMRRVISSISTVVSAKAASYLIPWSTLQSIGWWSMQSNVQIIPNIHITDPDYAGDIALPAGSYEEIQTVLASPNTFASQIGLRINTDKTKIIYACVLDNSKRVTTLDGNPF